MPQNRMSGGRSDHNWCHIISKYELLIERPIKKKIELVLRVLFCNQSERLKCKAPKAL